jgi:hypothetical protein
MLLVKCGQCGASYKLSEELYRRKAAGFGVVVTCRRCKTEIHVDSVPSAATEETTAESDAAPTAPTHDRPEPPASLDEETPSPVAPEPALAKTPEPALAKTPEPAGARVTPMALGPTPLAAKPGVLRVPGAPPRPAAATVKGIGVDAVKAAGAQKANEAKAVSPPAPRVQLGAKTAPRLVALSPGLLGTVTAPKPKPPAPPSPAAVSPNPPPAASPSPPTAALPPVAPVRSTAAKPPAPAPVRDPEEAAWSLPPPVPESSGADSEIPVASQDFLSADSGPVSEMSIDSKDLVTDVSSAAAPIQEAPDAPKKRLPEAPAPRRGPKAEPKPDELPSTTGTPKLDTLVHGTAVPLDQKKGAPPRKRLPSGDLSDDFMSADLTFDSPALAPPSADALTRAPVSSRPAAAAPTPSTSPSRPSDSKGVSSKSARPVTAKAEKKAASGRGWVALLLLAGLGVGGFAFRDRLGGAAAPIPAETSAPTPPKSEPAVPEEPATEPAAAPTQPDAPAAEPAVGGPAAVPKASDPGSAASPATPSPGVTAGTPRPATAEPAKGTASTAPATRPTAAPAPDPAAPEPTPTSPAKPIEPRPPVGTEPFDAAAARAALDASAAQASSCRKPGDPSGVAVVIITFSPTGRVTTATISGPPFAATPTGGCIASTLRKTRVPAFAGDMVTVRKTVTIH